jgi:benzodiazapine receptor
MWSLWSILALVVAVAIPIGVGFLGNVAGGGGVDDWYRELNKPSWTPPDWVFPVMWTTLYILMGVSSWLVWTEGGFSLQAYPLGAYIFQLVLNFLWSPIFFGMHRVGHALVEIIILWLAIAVTIYLFFPVNAVAAYLLVPYIAWVTVATALNAYIWLYNGDGGSGVTQPLQSG